MRNILLHLTFMASNARDNQSNYNMWQTELKRLLNELRPALVGKKISQTFFQQLAPISFRVSGGSSDSSNSRGGNSSSSSNSSNNSGGNSSNSNGRIFKVMDSDRVLLSLRVQQGVKIFILIDLYLM